MGSYTSVSLVCLRDLFYGDTYLMQALNWCIIYNNLFKNKEIAQIFNSCTMTVETAVE